MSEGTGLLGFVMAIALCVAVVIAQILANVFSAVDPGAAF